MRKPTVVDAGDVIVKITGSTICGSDLHLYHGARKYSYCCTNYSPADFMQVLFLSYRKAMFLAMNAVV